MDIQLGELQLNTLMEKFGAGGHKPGAGSAAALQGMVSAKLLKTVIDLTTERESYKDIWSRFKEIQLEIEKKLYPRLQALMCKFSSK